MDARDVHHERQSGFILHGLPHDPNEVPDAVLRDVAAVELLQEADGQREHEDQRQQHCVVLVDRQAPAPAARRSQRAAGVVRAGAVQ